MKKSKYKTQRSNNRGIVILGVVAAIIFTAVVITLSVFNVTSVEVEGNEHYTEQEIKDLVLGENNYSTNSIYLSWKYKNYNRDIPFISSMDVDMLSTHKIRIRVYEKSIIGYIEYLGSNMYFDKDGIIVESSMEKIEDVPLISGLEFQKITLYQELPVKDRKIFNTILNLTRFLEKTEVIPDKIYFSENMDITLYFGESRVLLGQDEDMEEKVSRLNSILPELGDIPGTLHMENFSEESNHITFKKD
jgi:cell division protein FtsQ